MGAVDDRHGFAQSSTQLPILDSIALIGTVALEPIWTVGSARSPQQRARQAFGTVRGYSPPPSASWSTLLLGRFGGNTDGGAGHVRDGGLSIFSGLLILLFVHEPKHVSQVTGEELKAEAGMFRLSDAAKLFKIPTLALMAPMLLFVTSLILFGFVGTYWARNLGYGVTNASYLYTVMTIGMTISAFLGGFLGDLFARRFGDKGRIMLFQIYALLFAASTFVMVGLPSVFDPDVAPGSGNAVTNSPSVPYYVVVFITGLIFSWGFSGCVLPMVSRVCPKQLGGHLVRRAVLARPRPDHRDLQPGRRSHLAGDRQSAAHIGALRIHPVRAERDLLDRVLQVLPEGCRAAARTLRAHRAGQVLRRRSDPVRLGIIGLGAEGGLYATLLADDRAPGMRLGAICDILPEKKEAADSYGVPFYADYTDLVTSGDVDAVVTTVPHYLHPEMGIYALEHGVHALVEKPVGVYTRQARELIHVAATKPQLTFGVFFNQRTNQLYRDLKALLGSGELGALRHTSWIITTWWRPQGYYDQSDWRATWGGEGGGVLVNQVPHQLDLWQWICGVPKSVFAKCAYGFRRTSPSRTR